MKLGLLVFILIVGCTHGPAEGPAARSAADARGPALFELHSGAWINLHHVLWGQAVERRARGHNRDHSEPGLEDLDAAALAEPDAGTWRAAIDFYVTAYADRDFTFDEAMVELNNRLSALDDRADIRQAQLPGELAEILARAMPIYRAHFWPAHDRTNRAWIAALTPWLARDGAELARELADIYHSAWPKYPLRVDVTRYASWSGAYTTLGPDHLTISGADPRNQGASALEILLHEASHAIVRPLRDALDHELAAQGKSSRDLWHAVLFFSTGCVVKRRVGVDYVPYAHKYQLYARAWSTYLTALESAWTPYLEGKTPFEAAVHDLVAAIP